MLNNDNDNEIIEQEDESIVFDNSIKEVIVDASTIFPFFDRKDFKIEIPPRTSPEDCIVLEVYRLFNEDGERKREKIKDVDIPIGATKEYVKSMLGSGNFLFVVKNKLNGKFLVSKSIQFIEDDYVYQEKQQKETITKMEGGYDMDVNIIIKEYEELKNKYNDVLREKDNLKDMISTIKNEKARVELELEQSKKNIESLRSENSSYLARLKDYEDNLKSMRDELNALKKEYEKEIKEYEKKINELNNQLRDVNFEKKSLEKDLNNLKETIIELKNEKSKLETENITLRSFKEMKQDNKLTDMLAVLINQLMESNKEKVLANADIIKSKIEALRDIEVTKLQALKDVEDELSEQEISSVDEEPKNDNILSKLIETFGKNFITPIANVLEQAGYSVVNKDELEKAINERVELARLAERKKIAENLEKGKKKIEKVSLQEKDTVIESTNEKE